ncbi:MAG: YceI family protein [Acidobacteriota bacterium]|nr:YceI family protein [Acidobacteriota bacterium]
MTKTTYAESPNHSWASVRKWLPAAVLLAAVAALPVPNATASETTGWSPDTSHTEINFSVNHFFTPVSGSFKEYEIDLAYDAENPENSSVEARIKVASLDTGNEKRDEHLRSADWFETEEHPYMTFKSTSVRRTGENQLVASGPLTIKGRSHPVELPIALLGNQMIPEQMQAMLGGTKEVASFKATTAIERSDFGVGVGNWAATMVVGGEVDIEILLEAHNK